MQNKILLTFVLTASLISTVVRAEQGGSGHYMPGATVPDSLLQFHPRTKMLPDAEAASSLARSEYYQWIYKNNPTWQTDL